MRITSLGAPVLVFGLLGYAWTASGQPPADEYRAALHNLPGVLVVVEPPNPQTGLTANQLTRDVEQWLLQARIRTLTRDEYQRTAGEPVLHVEVQADQPPAADLKGLLLFTVHVALYQRVTLQRDPKTSVLASTWEGDVGVGYADQGVASTFVRTGVRDVIDKFIAAMNEANGTVSTSPIIPPTLPQVRSSEAPHTQPSGQKSSQKSSDPKQILRDARTIAVQQNGGNPELQVAVERELQSWGRFSVVANPSQADLILDVSPTADVSLMVGKGAKAVAVLTSRDGVRLWSTVQGGDWSMAGYTFPKVGKAIVQDLRKFAGK